MSGISGISGGSGKVPPESNNDGDKKLDKGDLGGHNVSSHGSSPEVTSSGASVHERARALLANNFQVRSPDEQRHLESQQSRTEHRGIFSRIRDVFARLFRRQSYRVEISDPQVPSYQRHGVKIPGVGEFRMQYLMKVGNNGQIIDGQNTQETSEEEGVSSDSTERTHAAESKDTGKTSNIGKSSKAGMGSKIANLFTKAWSKTNEPQGPLDPKHLVSPEELRNMSKSYEKLAEMSENDVEKQQMQKLANDCSKRADLLESFSKREEDPLEGTSSAFAHAFGVDRGDSGVSLQNWSDEELLATIENGRDAESVLSSLESDVQVVLESADKASLQLQEESSLSQSVRERVGDALRRLGRSILSILVVIRTVIVGLCRRLRRGLMALGEAITRCCRHNQDRGMYEERGVPSPERDSGSREPESRIEGALREHINSILNPGDSGNDEPFSIPDQVVNQWRRGAISSIVVDLQDDVGDGYSVIGGYGADGLYEIINPDPVSYEFPEDLFALAVTPGYGIAAEAAVLAEALARRERRVRFDLNDEVQEFDPQDPPSAVRRGRDGAGSNVNTGENETLLFRLRSVFSNFLSKTSKT